MQKNYSYRFITLVIPVLIVLSTQHVEGQAVSQTYRVPEQLSIRFEGGLSPTNFGEVVAQLGRRDLVQITGYIDKVGVTLEEVLRRTNRLIGTAVTPELESYLCEINLHVCSMPEQTSKGKSPPRVRWNNGKMPLDAEPLKVNCPSRDLPAYALCLPDLKVDSYQTSAVYAYDARRERLAHLVVYRSQGCDFFDEKCREVIRRLNAGRTKTDPFSTQYVGEIRLPVRAYRISHDFMEIQLYS